MSYLKQDKFEERPSSLVFNGGKAGIVRGCKVVVKRRGADDPTNQPMYRLEVYDTDQQTNTNDSITIYPVNKGFFYREEKWNSEAHEKYAVNELKHLLKTFDHPIEKNSKGVDDIVEQRDIKDYNDFIDYTFEFLGKTLSENKGLMFDIAVDYGTEEFPQKYLQLNGYPWYIMKQGSTISNKNNAKMDRPTPDGEETEGEAKEEPSTNWFDQ